MKKEYNFSNGVRGKFYNADAEFNLPIYLESEIAEFVQKSADGKKPEIGLFDNLLLKKDKENI